MITSADNILFRCSSLGYLMTEPRSKSETLSETTKTHLIDKYVSAKYERETDIGNKYIEKGNLVEESSLTLYSRIKKEFYTKNKDSHANAFICGTPDLVTGDTVIDIKSSWDIFTFHRAKFSDVNKMYKWQLLGYMALTGCKKATLAYCLVNTPPALIEQEKNKLKWKMGVISETDPLYFEACEKIDRLMIYDDIPLADRMVEINVERNDTEVEKLYNRIAECRKWMNENLFNPQ